MNTVLHWLGEYGLVVAFLNVLFGQLGVPVPAYPMLIVTGALSAQGRYSSVALLAVAVSACLLADLAWYTGGRKFGRRVLSLVCRISISPDTCVRQTESAFARWGVWSLLVAKLIPGFGAVATALSGNMRVPLALFILVDALGAALYSGIAIGLGMLFRDAVDDVISVFERLGAIGLATLLLGFAIYLAWKWWQRYRMIRELRMTRISVAELGQLIDSGLAPTILDVRPDLSRDRDGIIPGALPWSSHAGLEHMPEVGRDTEVIVYCACPNEASAALVARQLKLAGFKNVRPLHGGIDAWIASGLPVDRPAGVAAKQAR